MAVQEESRIKDELAKDLKREIKRMEIRGDRDIQEYKEQAEAEVAAITERLQVPPASNPLTPIYDLNAPTSHQLRPLGVFT
eukprot:1194372-Prorocentrum_minimum.AAC.2